MVDASMQANIEQQLERLLSQLSDIEEVQNTDEISPEELAELKEDTQNQITEFEGFLKRLLAQNAQLESAKSAQAKIDQAKGKVFGVKEIKQALEAGQGANYRDQLANLKEDKSLGKVTDEQFRQRALELLSQLERCTTLNQDEQTLKAQFQRHGTTQIAGSGTDEISGQAAQVIHAATSAQISNAK